MNKKVTITLRLTVDEERILDRVARAQGTSRSETLRAALIAEASRLERRQYQSAYEQIKRYIPAKGSGWKGRRPSALDSKRVWAEDIERKHRAIRPD